MQSQLYPCHAERWPAALSFRFQKSGRGRAYDLEAMLQDEWEHVSKLHQCASLAYAILCFGA